MTHSDIVWDFHVAVHLLIQKDNDDTNHIKLMGQCQVISLKKKIYPLEKPR